MKHIKEYNKYFTDSATIYRIWDNNHNAILEFEESGNVYLASAYSDAGKEILDSLNIDPSKHEITEIDEILTQIKNKFPQYKVDKW
jgi:hypothetical protein